MLKLKLQYFGHLMWRTDSLVKTLMMGKIEGRRRKGWQRMSWLYGITDVMDMDMSKLRELLMDRKAWPAAFHGVAKSQTRLERLNWTELIVALPCCVIFCCTMKWISYTCTYVPSFLDLPPTTTPVSHRRAPSWVPTAVTQLPARQLSYTWRCYMPVPISQFIPLSPSLPLIVFTSPLSMSLSLFLPCSWVHLYCFLESVAKSGIHWPLF